MNDLHVTLLINQSRSFDHGILESGHGVVKEFL